MKNYIILLLLLWNTGAQAQKPWRAKLFAYFTDTAGQRIIDTVYVGCDTAAAEGFQAGLDYYDNEIVANKILCEDAVIFQEEGISCGILKTNIKGFKIGKVEFDFQLYGDFNHIDSIGWDTTDFLYADKFRLIEASLSTKDGYIGGIDGTEDILFWYDKSNGTNNFYPPTDSEIIIEAPHYRCETLFDDFRIKLSVYFAYFTGIYEPESTTNWHIYPNPILANDLTIVNPNSLLKSIILRDITGKLVPVIFISESDKIKLNVMDLPKGVYTLTITDQLNNNYNKKITKL